VFYNKQDNHDWSLVSSLFLSNIAESYGGGVFYNQQDNHDWVLVSSQFSWNIALYGGVMYNEQDNHDWNITGCVFDSNSGDASGGVIEKANYDWIYCLPL
jgi:hypothetical protein